MHILVVRGMIARDAKPTSHNSPYKRIDIMHPGRKRWVTRQDVQDGKCREPDPEAYSYDGLGIWTLKESAP